MEQVEQENSLKEAGIRVLIPSFPLGLIPAGTQKHAVNWFSWWMSTSDPVLLYSLGQDSYGVLLIPSQLLGQDSWCQEQWNVHPSMPCLLPPPRRAGTACTSPCSWPETQQFPQEWITNKKPNNSYLRRFHLSPELSCAVSYSWQFILQEFSHLRLQWLMWWTFCPFPGKSLAWSSTPPAIFLEGLSSHFSFI